MKARFFVGKNSPTQNLRSKRHGKGLLETAHPQMVGLELKALWHQPSERKKKHAGLAVVDDNNFKLMFFWGERGRGFGSYMKGNNS